MVYSAHDEISLDPIKRDLKGYSIETFKADVYAGLIVALLAVPQALAYSLVAGLPLSCGLLAAVFGTLIAALFGSSSQLVVGPTNAISLLVLYATSEVLFTHYRGIDGPEREIVAIQIMTQLALLVAVMQIAAAIFKLGRMFQFVSHSVIVGYLAGTALAIIINQLFTFLGLTPAQGLFSLYEKSLYILFHLTDTHLPTLIIGLGSMAILVALKKINGRIPSPAIMLVIAGLIVHVLGLSSYTETGLLSRYTEGQIGNVTLVGDAGEIHAMLPRFRLPSFNTGLMNNLLPYGFAIALLSILEATSVAKSIAASTRQRLAVNQEILGLGLGNFASALTGGLLCSGSSIRSSLNYQSGARTRIAAISSAVFVAAIVVSLGYVVSRTPLASLSALLLVSAVRIVNPKQFFLCLKATRSDCMAILATLLACLFFSLDIAFYTGILISITLYLKKAAMPHLVECTYDELGRIGSLDQAHRQEHKLIRVINVQGELFFGAADLFQTSLKSIAEEDNSTRVFILRLKNARDIDATTCLAIEQLYEYFKDTGRHLLACGLTYNTWQILCNAGLVDEIGKDNLFIQDDRRPNESLQRAIVRAKQIISVPEAVKQHAPVVETHVLRPAQG